jgi:polyisoprenoid-binding protein YceI
MKKLTLMAGAIAFSVLKIAAQSDYATETGHVSFFSKAPVADVDAKNDKVKVTLNTDSREITFHMAMIDFQFQNQKMGRDARDKYLETEKYAEAAFRGKINGKFDPRKTGTYPVTATGKLKIHGVEKLVTEKGKIVVEKGIVKLQSQFHVVLKDYKINTPKILGHEMTEENMLVKVDATLSESSKVISKK